MRSSLADVATVLNVDTDCSNRTCSFQVDLDQVDIGSRLHELSADNDKLKEWSLAKMEPVVMDETSADSDDNQDATEESAEDTSESADEVGSLDADDGQSADS